MIPIIQLQTLLKTIWLNVHKSTVTMYKNLKNCTNVVINGQESTIWINLLGKEWERERGRERER